MGKVLVLGFYNRDNLGDEMFKETIPLLIPHFDPIFISIDDLENTNISLQEYKGIICGGGDLFNKYFLDPISKILPGFSGPIFLLGVGIPYSSMIEDSHLNLFDRIFLREQTDLRTVGRKIGCSYVHVLPDLGFLKPPRTWTPSGTVGIFLATPSLQELEITRLIPLVKRAQKHGTLHLIRFNTSTNPDEDDSIINTLISEQFPEAINDPKIYNTDELLTIMSGMNMAICGRFHAHIFATIAGVPFLSVGITRKVDLFLEEANLTHLRGINPEDLDRIWADRDQISKQLFDLAEANHFRLQTNQVDNLLLLGEKRVKDQIDQEKIYQMTRKHIFQLTGSDLERGVPQLSEEQSKKVAAKMCFQLTRTPSSKYEWGTSENLRVNPQGLRLMIDWIVQEHQKENRLPHLQLDLYDQSDLKGVHRAGWQYVMDHLRIFQSDKGVICDIFTDRTFLWGSWVLAEQGIIPYTSEWIGFLHHCPNEEYTPNNAQEILRSPLFRRSLPTCKGLFCLSETLASWYQKQLPGIKVESLHHPTLFVDRFWAPDPHIRLINVGAWYRDPFAIYELEVPSYVDKWSLKGPRMEQYFRPDRLVLTHEQILNPTRSMNRWVYYLCKYLQRTYSLTEESLDLDQLSPKYEALAKKLASVQVLDRVSNQEYDELFSNSVIFLRLVDASAVNTVIEAIVRNTPILINRLPALEEYLGSNYPLFYENLSEASALLTPDQLERAHLHLQSMDRSFLKIDHFLEQYLKSEIYQKSLL